MAFSVDKLIPGISSCADFAAKRFAKTETVDVLPAIQRISSCNMDGIYERLLTKLPSDFLQIDGNNVTFAKPNLLKETLIFPFYDLPCIILDYAARKLGIESLQNSKLLTKYRNGCENKKYERAMRGLLKNGKNFIYDKAKKYGIEDASVINDLAQKNARMDNLLEELVEEGLSPEEALKTIIQRGEYSNEFGKISSEVKDDFHKIIDLNFAKDKAHYHTPHERTVVRIVSGTTAAIMLGNDFYNKSILNGMSDEEAKKEAKGKRKQEMVATGMEAVSQYMFLGAFSGFANNSKFGAPIINTLLGIFFHITSRLSTGRKITRMKLPDSEYTIKNQPSMKKFVETAKNGDNVEYKETIKEKKEKKKHLLSLKNLGLAFAVCAIGGFGINKLTSSNLYNKAKENILNTDFAKNIMNKIQKFTKDELWISKEELNEFTNILTESGHASVTNTSAKKLLHSFNNSSNIKKFVNRDGSTVDKIFVGKYDKTTRIPFTNVEITNREILNMPLAPLKFIRNILGYPYKILSGLANKTKNGICSVLKIESTANSVQKNSNKLNASSSVQKIAEDNASGMLNTLLDYKTMLDKNGGRVTDKFIKDYLKHYEDIMLGALNYETQSKVKNTAIGKTTQLLGTAGSIYFATTDDFNRTAKQTGDKDKAEKDARLRGINKIIRIGTQIAVLELNDVFKISYAKSILGAGIITGICTILTDSISRVLSGMPFVKMNKEQLEEYNKKQKEGPLKGYYSALDKLTD